MACQVSGRQTKSDNVLGACATGIIVDGFGNLRDEKTEVDTAMKTECFICGIKSAEFDRKGSGGWDQHKTKEHHIWDYLYYFIYLDEKAVTEYTYIEHKIAEKLVAEDYDFFPIERALALQENSGGDDAAPADAGINADVAKRVGDIEKTLGAILALLKPPSTAPATATTASSKEEFGFGEDADEELNV